jgi:hypothetical protein
MENNFENPIVAQKLEELNKGFNFFNFTQTKKKYYIKVNLVVTQDLKTREEVLDVRDNLYVTHRGYYKEYDVVDFLKDLKEFSEKPLAKIMTISRKGYGYNGNYSYNSYSNGYSEIKDKIRTETINFSDIEISIGDLAREKLKKIDIDFESEVKEILKKQKDINKEMQEKVNRYVFLEEKISMLKSLIKEESRYSYSYNKPKDNTSKIILSPNEYNTKLKEIETEMRELEKYFGLKEMRFDYIKIQEEVSYENWFKENERELRINFSESESEMTFEEYAEQVFEQRDSDDEFEETEEEYEDSEEE